MPKVRATLEQQLPLQLPVLHPVAELEENTTMVIQAYQAAIESSIPLTKAHPRVGSGINKEVMALITICRTAYWRQRDHPTPENKEAYKEAKNIKKRAVKKSIKEAWRERLAEVLATINGL